MCLTCCIAGAGGYSYLIVCISFTWQFSILPLLLFMMSHQPIAITWEDCVITWACFNSPVFWSQRSGTLTQQFFKVGKHNFSIYFFYLHNSTFCNIILCLSIAVACKYFFPKLVSCMLWIFMCLRWVFNILTKCWYLTVCICYKWKTFHEWKMSTEWFIYFFKVFKYADSLLTYWFMLRCLPAKTIVAIQILEFCILSCKI